MFQIIFPASDARSSENGLAIVMVRQCTCDACDLHYLHHLTRPPALQSGLSLEPSQFSRIKLVVWKLTRQICKDFACLFPISIPQGGDSEQESRVRE
jgi:hypothetical protein